MRLDIHIAVVCVRVCACVCVCVCVCVLACACVLFFDLCQKMLNLSNEKIRLELQRLQLNMLEDFLSGQCDVASTGLKEAEVSPMTSVLHCCRLQLSHVCTALLQGTVVSCLYCTVAGYRLLTRRDQGYHLFRFVGNTLIFTGRSDKPTENNLRFLTGIVLESALVCCFRLLES